MTSDSFTVARAKLVLPRSLVELRDYINSDRAAPTCAGKWRGQLCGHGKRAVRVFFPEATSDNNDAGQLQIVKLITKSNRRCALGPLRRLVTALHQCLAANKSFPLSRRARCSISSSFGGGWTSIFWNVQERSALTHSAFYVKYRDDAPLTEKSHEIRQASWSSPPADSTTQVENAESVLRLGNMSDGVTCSQKVCEKVKGLRAPLKSLHANVNPPGESMLSLFLLTLSSR